MDLILPANTERIVPSWFSTKLKDTDPNLIVYFNPHKGRWIIDRCSRDGEFSSVPHTHVPMFWSFRRRTADTSRYAMRLYPVSDLWTHGTGTAQ
jgi:hypothetical protein